MVSRRGRSQSIRCRPLPRPLNRCHAPRGGCVGDPSRSGRPVVRAWRDRESQPRSRPGRGGAVRDRPFQSESRAMIPIEADERGAALVIVLVATILLLTLGGALVLVASSEEAIASNYRIATEGLYAADAALQSAIADFAGEPNWDAVLG